MAAHTLKSSAPVASKEEAMEKFSFAEYFGEINALADLQFMPGEKPYVDRPSASPEPKELMLLSRLQRAQDRASR
jgi:hypothetical protein